MRLSVLQVLVYSVTLSQHRFSLFFSHTRTQTESSTFFFASVHLMFIKIHVILLFSSTIVFRQQPTLSGYAHS